MGGGDRVLVDGARATALPARCPHCGVKCPGYDAGSGERQWRTLDLGTTYCVLSAAAPRVKCAQHGVVVAWVPWARHESRFTRAFEDQVGWLVTHTDRTTVSRLMRIAWGSVERMVERLIEEAMASTRPLEGLRRIGIDEVSFRKGQRYLTVAFDHERGRLIWAAEGRDEATLAGFFKRVGTAGCAKIELVSADAASWIRSTVTRYCPNAKLCLDPFHVVSWATDALDEIRREARNAARRSGDKYLAKVFKSGRVALWKNPSNLTAKQTTRLADIARASGKVHRAYLLKELLREIFRLKGEDGGALLDHWLAWASRSRLKPFVDLAARVRRHLDAIHDVLEHRLSNARVEAANTKIRLLQRMAFGVHSAQALINLAMLRLGGIAPALPGR